MTLEFKRGHLNARIVYAVYTVHTFALEFKQEDLNARRVYTVYTVHTFKAFLLYVVFHMVTQQDKILKRKLKCVQCTCHTLISNLMCQVFCFSVINLFTSNRFIWIFWS